MLFFYRSTSADQLQHSKLKFRVSWRQQSLRLGSGFLPLQHLGELTTWFAERFWPLFTFSLSVTWNRHKGRQGEIEDNPQGCFLYNGGRPVNTRGSREKKTQDYLDPGPVLQQPSLGRMGPLGVTVPFCVLNISHHGSCHWITQISQRPVFPPQVLSTLFPGLSLLFKSGPPLPKTWPRSWVFIKGKTRKRQPRGVDGSASTLRSAALFAPLILASLWFPLLWLPRPPQFLKFISEPVVTTDWKTTPPKRY